MLNKTLTSPYTLESRFVDIPIPRQGEVLLKVLQVGICGSDVQIYHGLHQYAKSPIVMGHECAALVESIGEGVSNCNIGDLVTVQPQILCGKCYACLHGKPNVCESLSFMGVHQDGFFSEYVIVPSWNVIKMPQGSTADMAMLTEPTAVAVNAAQKSGFCAGKRAVVIGAGPIGNLVAQVGVNMGCDIMITDVLDNKLQIAEACGIRHCVNTAEADLKEEIKRHLGAPADVIVDCAGVPSLFMPLLESAANGTELVIVANYKSNVTIDVQKIQRREIAIKGIMQYTRQEFSLARDMIADERISIRPIITNRYPLSELSHAFEYIDSHAKEVMKIAVMVDSAAGTRS